MIRIVFAVLVVLGLGAAAGAAQDASRSSATSSGAVAAPINLNTASVAQLETLPGIGRSTAERILEYRQKNGAFKKVEDILEKYGSCPDSLSILTRWPSNSVSQSRQESQ
jgi:competence ComEA-like helix-hairpin-helix protein